MPLKHVPQQSTPFEIGQVKAHVEHGLSAAAIAERVFKADGKTTFGTTAIQNCINKLYANPGWRGGRSKRLWELSTNQKERAKECLEQQPPGGRTSW